MEERTVSHEQAATLHQSGKVAEAAAMYEMLLERYPQDVELLTLFGIAQFQLDRTEEAESAWRRSFEIEASADVRVRSLANIVNVARSKGRTLDFITNLTIPDWPEGRVPDSEEKQIITALARGLVTHKRPEAACRLLDSALSILVADEEFVRSAAAVMLDAGEAEKALALLRPMTSRQGPVNAGLLIAHAAAANMANLTPEAKDLTQRALETVPVYLTAKKPTQLMLIGILSSPPLPITRALMPADFHFSVNTPSHLALSHNDQYRFLSIFPASKSTTSALANAPRPELVLNNWVNAEVLSTLGKLEFISDFADRLNVPVLNHPRTAVETTRQKNAATLADIPDLVVPRVMRFINNRVMSDRVVRVIQDTLRFPVIIRTSFAQQGAGAEKIDSPGELARYLATQGDPQLYAIEYVDNPVGPRAYRKIRAAVIGEELFITHVHFGPRWNVHREGDRERNFDLDGNLVAHAARMISAPEETLGAPAMAALHEIRRRIPLDIYGIDFDILPDGRVLFFEANADMRLSVSDRAGIEHTRAAMRTAVRRLFQKTASAKA
jgi:tetratricopeptide (TPR) repeat protein/glutathione synthase/RimK-type ligase-like ATP-grasp enzyme